MYINIGVWDNFRYTDTCMMHKRHMSLTRVLVAGNGHTFPMCSLKALHTWFKSLCAQWNSDDSRHTLWIHNLSIDNCAHCLDPFWTCIYIHHRSAENSDRMILTTNKTCEKPLRSNEWININANKQHQSSTVILMMIQQYLANKLRFAMLQ